MNTYIITAAADYLDAALAELRAYDPTLHMVFEQEEIAIVTLELSITDLYRRMQRRPPIFIRHIQPAQHQETLTGESSDLRLMARATLALPTLALIDDETRFAVQARVLPTPGTERTYSPYAIKDAMAVLVAQKTEGTEDVRNPEVVISILALPTVGYIGISPVSFNLSDWAGGARRFAREEGQLTRSEFKLLEALEVFQIELPTEGRALDLGAAPGGWTRLLRTKGLRVTAVDPADMDANLQRDKGVQIIKGHAQEWVVLLREQKGKFDLIVSDMRMDARDAARLLVEAAPLMTLDSHAIMTFKLPPPGTPNLDPIAITHRALEELQSRFRVVQARQLFHNRHEVTVHLQL